MTEQDFHDLAMAYFTRVAAGWLPPCGAVLRSPRPTPTAACRSRWRRRAAVRHGRGGATLGITSKLILWPADFVGFIGRSPQYEGVYLCTGDGGQGLTTGVTASLLLRDLMTGSDSPWTDLYAPSRQMHHGLGEYVKENVEAARHWVELVAAREVGSVDDIMPGKGALVRLHGKPVAAFRDDVGDLHLHSAVCTHAGCVVHWNGFERCWDCPCHGSQFATDGQVLNGPAAKALAPVEGESERPAATATNETAERRA
jgi:nitrite reductase/ring-hydroxylating ferredoxin subunit